jgi:DNA-binding winged helix-turn-helix (wHTH) protein/Tfp pilus assembly protein PilF
MATFANVYDLSRTMQMRYMRIGPWVLDCSDGTLTGEHTVVRLEPKVLAVLLYLAERQGVVVPHEDLLRDVWRNTHVVPGALARTISLLRTALGDDAYSPHFIETVPKRGYRLIAEVAATTATRRDRPALRLVAAAATVLLLVSLGGGEPRDAARDNGMFRFPHDTRVGNETAFDYYSRARDANPRSAEAHAGLATTFVFRSIYLPDRERWTAAALESANRAVALNERSAMAARAAGMAHVHAGRHREAEQYYRRALELNPDDRSTPLNLGWLLSTTGRPEAAVELIRKRVAVRPDATSYAYLADALWLAGRLADATAAARTALEFEPFARQPRLLLIRSELIAGDHAAARAQSLRLLEAYPDCTECVIHLGLIDQLSGNLAGAEDRYRAAAAIPGPFNAASLRLAHVLTLTDRRQEAAQLLSAVQQSSRRAADDPQALSYPYWTLAAAAAIGGDRQEAVTRYHDAIRLGRRDRAWDAFEPMFDSVRPLPFEKP